MAHLVEHLALDFSSGHDLRILRSSRTWGSSLTGESAGDCLSPFPFPLSLLILSLTLSLSKDYINL